MNLNHRFLPVFSAIALVLSLLGHQFLPESMELIPVGLRTGLDGVFIFGIWISIALIINFLIDHFLWPRLFGPHVPGKPRPRKLVMQLVHVVVVGIAFGLALRQILSPELATMVAGSGVIAIVLGLALQSTLSDFFAGVALNLERPFRAGDWITLEDKTEGQVLLVNWRATHIRTRTADLLVVPNAVVARGRLINRAQPSTIHITNLTLRLKPGFNLDALQAVLTKAALSVRGVRHLPAPLIYVDGFNDWSVGVRMYYFIDEYDALLVIQGEVGNAVYAAIESDPQLKEYWPKFSIPKDA